MAGRDGIAADFDVPVLSKLPVHGDFDTERADGPVVRDDDSPAQADLVEMAAAVADRVGEVNRRQVARVGDDNSDDGGGPDGVPDRGPSGDKTADRGRGGECSCGGDQAPQPGRNHSR